MYRLLWRLRIWWFRRRHPGIPAFNPEGKTVFASANQAALASQATWIDAGHVLLGIVQTTALLEQLGVDSRAVSDAVLASSDAARSEKDRAKKVVEQAVAEARAIGVRELDAQLLLAGLCRLDGSIANKVLTEHGVTLERVRALRRTA